LRSIDGSTDGQRRITVDDMVEAIGHRGYGPFLLVPALMEISPLGGLPAVPTVLAAIVIIFAAQIAYGRNHLWLPRTLRKRELSARHLHRAVDKLKPFAQRIDGWFHGRLCSLSGDVGIRTAAVCCILLALAVPPLEFVPFASSAPMVAVAIFGLAITLRDGVLMLAGFLASIGAVALGIDLVMGR
jgi:hypothetical protein